MLHHLEAAALRSGLALLRALGPERASNLAGAVARGIGPLLPVTRIAEANLRLALPALDDAARRQVIRGTWDNLGRTIGEFPHLARIASLGATASGPGCEMIGEEHARSLLQGGPAIILTGHMANWEVQPPAAAHYGIRFGIAYRAAANPEVDAVIAGLRREGVGFAVPLFPKGAAGGRQALRHLQQGGVLGVLIDQKQNDGIPVPFFGVPAMTGTGLAALALRFRCPVYPVHAERLGPARFRVVCEPPLPLPDSGDRQADVRALMLAANACMERWIRARPQEWLWLHRRWPKRRLPDGAGPV